ncbi:phosphoglycerate mutase [Diaporthe amygdali]|uniref:phosphoglycerate mutase n=1 Tax=Phomopsis amygdali TaxID=1214568 RepID=UPI0022FDB31A|nr:phosphoglycerate mutase [Diaporthe amygdali]KAJ0114527.1 phosphoglycerate mutase [Diaporthe amygdali]
MGRAPAYIFVVRHGNRLDAANKQWHLQSPTPYDPPLTYSGWNQTRAVGQKIGEILRDGDKEREKEQQGDSPATNGSPRKRRKYKIVIHSSPFLRCIQTSIGISAGLASIPEPPPPSVTRSSSTHSVTNPRLRATVQPDVSVPPPTPPTGSRPNSRSKPVIQKTVLRLDAFLGEWLTPGYFELITPPPGSGLMLASAKAELLRKEDYNSYPNLYAHHSPHNSSSGPGTGLMWGQSPTVAAAENGLENVGSLAEAMRRAGRSDSVTSNGESHLITGGAYVAPVPSYALSHNAEIPRGYVPHARDNCCDVDYQWDSMRGTLDWGDGGSYGEEWTAMHQRFRKGLQSLVDWYATQEHPADMVTKERRDSVTASDDAIDEDEDVETESVVILVSHGAGCNALIGAITHQPVLTDVSLASLTSAIRKPGKDDIGNSPGTDLVTGINGTRADSPSGLVAIHQCYDLKLFASTEHLTSTRSGRSGSVTTQNRGRLSNAFTSSPLSGNDGSGSRSSSAAASLGSMRRESGASSRLASRLGLNTKGINSGGITVGSGVTSFLKQTPSSATGGLWSPLRNTLDTPEEDDDDDFLPNFTSFDIVSPSAKAEETERSAAEPSTPITNGNGTTRNRADSRVSPRAVPAPKSSHHEEEERNEVPALPQLGSGTGGLWGSPKPIGTIEIPRDLTSPKRRWTVTERWT